jgi:predicted MarR family transcription regulator
MSQTRKKKTPYRKWHLVKSDIDNSTVEFEWALMRLNTAFNRFNENAGKTISGFPMNSGEMNLLHVIRMHDTPKSASILATLLNRDDYSNIQYGLKKLRNLDLIKIHSKSKGKQYDYEVTELGRELTDKFVALRDNYVTEPVQLLQDWKSNLEITTRIARLMTGIYEEAARQALAYWDEDE